MKKEEMGKQSVLSDEMLLLGLSLVNSIADKKVDKKKRKLK